MQLLDQCVNSASDLQNPRILHEAYSERNLSIGKIAHMAGTTKSRVHYYLVKFGIERRPWTGLTLKREPTLMLELYKNEGKSLREISNLLGISRSTVWKHVSRQVQLRPRSIPKFSRAPFSQDETEKAYLLGLRAGDLNAFQDSAQTVTARVSTTRPAMLNTFHTIFSKYGHCITIPRKAFLTGYDWQVKAYLDNTFQFLIPKPLNPPSATSSLYAFAAGLSDSDGCWSASNGRGRTAFSFDITSSSCCLLERLSVVLAGRGYHPNLYLSRRQGTFKVVRGQTGNRLIRLTKDTWTLTIKRRGDVKRLAEHILPYSRHSEKIAKMTLILDGRNEEWREMGPKFEALREIIRSETRQAVSRAAIEYKARHKEPASGVVG